MHEKKISVLKRRRRFVAILVFLFFALFLFWSLFHKKNYTLEYELDGFKIRETYVKIQDTYYFQFVKENQEYNIILPSTHFISKKLVYKIEEIQDENETCIKLHSNKLRFSPLCLNQETQISYQLVSDSMKAKLGNVYDEVSKELQTVYQNINIYNYKNHDYYIWNYRGFYHLNESIQEEISLYEKDIYDPKLLTQVGDYLFIPDYNADYSFAKVTLIHRKSGKQEIWNLDTPIFFDSIILGTYEESIYLVDKHEKVEWKLTPKKKKQEKVGWENKLGITYQHGWQEVSITRLMNPDYSFTGIYPISYEIQNGLFAKFLDYSILLRKVSPSRIVSQVDDGVYYLEDNILYAFFPRHGEVKIMDSFEWNFNSNHVIFIF